MVLINPRQFLVQINGAVKEPGFIAVTPLTRLNEIIKEAGGYHQLAKEFEIQVNRSNRKNEVINYHDFILDGDLVSNPTFLEGDKILVPFGDLEKEGIVVRGSISGAGYDIISKGETLEKYIRRQVTFSKNADLQNVSLTRMENGTIHHMVVSPLNFGKTILRAQDEINFNWERGVMVNGFVRTPGGFSYYPGYSVADYISLAGGNTVKGNPSRVTVLHNDGSMEVGDRVIVRRGDVIYIPRTRKDILLGDMSVLGIFTAVLTLYLTFLSAAK
jgi:protein involved in polysaccharide export with SLBB domain